MTISSKRLLLNHPNIVPPINVKGKKNLVIQLLFIQSSEDMHKQYVPPRLQHSSYGTWSIYLYKYIGLYAEK
jgi:hypothetical protein